MEYTVLPEWVLKERDTACSPKTTLEEQWAKGDPTYFSYHYLGVRPFLYQHWLFREIRLEKKRLIVSSSRQIGKSTAVACLGLWAAMMNVHPTGLHSNTKVGIVSRSEDQSIKLLGEIKSIIGKGDAHLRKLTGGKTKRFVSDQLDPAGRNNASQITFSNGCWIKCFPPTDAVRGETFDFVFVDEAAMVGEDIFRDCILPTVSHTDGYIIISSTPKGQQGYYYRLFDPNDQLAEHEFERYWFPYTVLQGDKGDVEAERQLCFVEKQREHAAIRGDSRGFDQEYRALFTADEEAFLANAKVDEAVSADIDFEFSWPELCSVGVDYGMVNSRTVITVSTMDKGKIRLLWQHILPSGDDSSPLVPIEDFMKRYKVSKVVVDDCAQGFHVNKEMEDKGWPVQRFNFRSDQADRNKHYFSFRSALNQGILRVPVKARDLIHEMKALREIQNKVYTSIRAVEGEHDDCVDSFMMSCVPFLDKEGEFNSVAVDTSKSPQNNVWTDGRNDLQWKNLVETQKALDLGKGATK